jgi:hypothetical protein
MQTTCSVLIAAALAGLSCSAAAAPTWFEVAARDGRAQSYLLPIDDPEQLTQARAQLDGPQDGGQLIVARIRAGGDGLNRNLRLSGQPLWSWHVAELLEFSDLSIELCDGSPQLVEDDPAAFVANTGGVICFWGYSLASELPRAPRIALDDQLDGFWHSPAAVGSGFAIDVLEDQNAIAIAWLRHAADGAPLWQIGVGTLPADGEAPLRVVLEAPRAGAAVSPVPAVAVQLRFLDCNRAELVLEQPAGETLAIQRSAPKQNCAGR